MNHTRLLVAASIIAVVIVGGFVLSVPHTRDIVETTLSQNVTPSVPQVTVHDAFKKGTHTITGSLEAPNACTIVTAHASVVGDATSTESILVALSMPADMGVCLQLPTTITFSTTIVAPARLPITVTVNGLSATTTTS